MELTEVEINKIKPDPNQPRTSIDEIDLREMAQSMVTEGVINPIEIDSKFVIITGERRWRAAKIAGLKTVPAKILNIDGDERFMRQVIENIHHNTMSDWDTANALKKLLSLSPGDRHPQAPITGPGADKGITWLSVKTGKSRGYIDEKLSLLETSKPFQKAVREGTIAGTFVRAIKQAPEAFKVAVEKKILANEFTTRDGAKEFVAALKREENNPTRVKKLLDTDYSKFKGVGEVEQEVKKISPRVSDMVIRSYEPSHEISRISDDLKEWVMNNPREKIGLVHAPRIIVNMNFMKTLIEEWFHSAEERKKLK